MDNNSQVAVWWQRERQREFTRLECGLLGAVFAAVGVGFIVALRAYFG